jgi:hypothetical protein
VAIRFDTARLGLVKGLKSTDEQDNRNILEGRGVFNELAELVSILPRHEDIGQDKVRVDLGQTALGHFAVAYGNDIDAFVGKSQVHHFLYGDTVIR